VPLDNDREGRMKRILLALLAFYKRWLSPAIHALGWASCKFQPTCSEYAATAIAIYGPFRGTAMAAWRLLRCHPFSPGGFDPVPLPRVEGGNTAGRSQPPFPHKPLP
jgi:uncharacterized protein